MSFTENQPRPHIVNDDPLFDTFDAAAYLGTSIPTLERWRRLGTGPDWVKMSGIVRYRKSCLDSHIDECTRRPHGRRRRGKFSQAR